MYEKTLSRYYCCRGKAVSIAYSECVFVVLLIQHTKHMSCFTWSSVACPGLSYFFTLYYKRDNFREKTYGA
jgi:hypothetical protein